VTPPRPDVRAHAKFVRVSPRKARLVADHIRGRTVPEARTILAFTPRAAAHEVEKVLKSAVANAESNPNLRWNGDDLVISAVYVDEGPTLKRWQARARGRMNQILKRTCHITIKVAPAAQPRLEGTSTETRGQSASESKPKRRAKKKEAVA
jgi:large subunit ribosomal protein L22